MIADVRDRAFVYILEPRAALIAHVRGPRTAQFHTLWGCGPRSLWTVARAHGFQIEIFLFVILLEVLMEFN